MLMNELAKKPKLIIAIVLALLALVVILQNTQTVDTRILFFTVSMPRALLLLCTALLGFGIGLTVSMVSKRNQKDKS